MLSKIICKKCRKKTHFDASYGKKFMCRKCDHREYKLNKEKTCGCSGYWFPHRYKSGRCFYNPAREKYFHLEGVDE